MKSITTLISSVRKRKIRIAIVVSVFCGACASLMMPGENPRCIGFRAEGLSLGEALPNGLKYLRKSFILNWCDPDSLRDHFAGQAENLRTTSVARPDCQETVSIAFVGDIMWIRNSWDTFADERLVAGLSAFDMVFGNLETPIDTLSGVPSLFPDYVRYNARPGLLRSFRREDGTSIFTALSLANNHPFDRGAQGLAGTHAFLHAEGIKATGASLPGDSLPDYIIAESKGIRIGFHAAGWGLNKPALIEDGKLMMNVIPGIAPLNNEAIDIKAAKSVIAAMEADSVDIKVLYLHWGYEYEMFPDAAIVSLARRLAEAGADLVIGSHPHVIQPCEIWETPSALAASGVRKTLIAYSLGNFTTTMYSPAHRLGMVLPVTIGRDKVSGETRWQVVNPLYVYNHVSGIAGRKRRLMLYEDYINELKERSTRKASRAVTRLEPIFGLTF